MKKTSQNKPPANNDSAPVKKPKLLFVGEGPDDVGRDATPGGAAAGFLHAALKGPSPPIDDDSLPFIIGKIQYWSKLTLQIPPNRRQQKNSTFEEMVATGSDGRRVLAAITLARTLELDTVFVLKDCEQQDRFDLLKELRNAKHQFQANDPADKPPSLVVATPSRVHETWLLADSAAVRRVFGDQGVYSFSKSPEERPHSDELKSHIKSHASRCLMKPHEARRQLAFQASPKSLKSRCPECYPLFLEDVNQELRPLIP